MGEFTTFIEGHPITILTLLSCVVLVLLAVQWVAWIFSFGRFGKEPVQAERTQNIRYLLADGLVKIINDFRHLLALLIVLIFGLALAYALWSAGTDSDSIKEMLQAVTSTLGGLVGSIIGYYFGESAGRRSASNGTIAAPPTGNGSPLIQGDAQSTEVAEVREVRRPDSKEEMTKSLDQGASKQKTEDSSDTTDSTH